MQITYSFPTFASDYTYTYEPGQSFAPITEAMKQSVLAAFEALSGFTNLTFVEGDPTTATIRFAQSDAPATAYAYLPGDYDQASDIWFGRSFDYTRPQAGNYAWHTIWHEIGHALGLDHMNDLSLQQSIMSYRTYDGGYVGAYSYSARSAPQTFMSADITALQAIYGVNESYNADDTVYSWTPNQRKIFETIYDAGGTDTFDFSNYTSGLRINLSEGASSRLGKDQVANLGSGHSADGSVYIADGVVIENVIGGSGNDRFRGNASDNVFTGGYGRDTFVFRPGEGNDTITDFEVGVDRIVLKGVDMEWVDGNTMWFDPDQSLTLLNIDPNTIVITL